jgi:hypothetical protein
MSAAIQAGSLTDSEQIELVRSITRTVDIVGGAQRRPANLPGGRERS